MLNACKSVIVVLIHGMFTIKVLSQLQSYVLIKFH